MNKLIISFFMVGVLGLGSCNTYHSFSSATKLSHLSANPFYQKVAKSVLTNVASEVISKGLTSFKGKPKLLSTLSSLLNTAQSVSTFKNMLSSKYGISSGLIENNYGQWNTLRDVISFVALKATKADFTSYSNKILK